MRGMNAIAGFVIGILIYHFFFVPTIDPVFSPQDGNQIIDLIDGAEKSIDIEMYVFTSREIVEALMRAKYRGVDIRIILERSTISGSNTEIFNELASKGINIRYASESFATTHSKFIIIDSKKVLVGSHNFSNSALHKNREASVIIADYFTALDFISLFNQDWALAS